MRWQKSWDSCVMVMSTESSLMNLLNLLERYIHAPSFNFVMTVFINLGVALIFSTSSINTMTMYRDKTFST